MNADIIRLVFEAQNDVRELNKLIEGFLPFIKKCVAQSRGTKQSQEDALTLAMLTFADCVKSYNQEKGAFLSFAQISIRNRLIDDFRYEQKSTSQNIPMLEPDTENAGWETKLSFNEYKYQLERDALKFEIEEISAKLALWNTSFSELSKICPKQKRTRAQCEYIATLILKNDAWRAQLLEKHRMPSKEMCSLYGVSIKILEKYRKYIAALCMIQNGNYPMLHVFLPMNRKKGVYDE